MITSSRDTGQPSKAQHQAAPLSVIDDRTVHKRQRAPQRQQSPEGPQVEATRASNVSDPVVYSTAFSGFTLGKKSQAQSDLTLGKKSEAQSDPSLPEQPQLPQAQLQHHPQQGIALDQWAEHSHVPEQQQGGKGQRLTGVYASQDTAAQMQGPTVALPPCVPQSSLPKSSLQSQLPQPQQLQPQLQQQLSPPAFLRVGSSRSVQGCAGFEGVAMLQKERGASIGDGNRNRKVTEAQQAPAEQHISLLDALSNKVCTRPMLVFMDHPFQLSTDCVLTWCLSIAEAQESQACSSSARCQQSGCA